MFEDNLPVGFWGECVFTAVHLINRTPSGVLGNKTPYEMIFGHVLNSTFCVCLDVCALFIIKKSKRDKFTPYES